MENCFITPLQFGAKGDGIHDDAPAIQKAMLEAYKRGKDLFVPAGQYLLATLNFSNKADGGKTAAALHIFPGMRLYGETGTVFLAGEGITHIIINDNGDNDSDNFGARGYNGGENYTIERITFDGGILLGNSKCTPVNFSHAKNIRLRDITVKNTGAGWHCIEINSSFNTEISGCILGENCDCSELIQLDAATNEGNLGENDMTADRYVRIFNNYFYCNKCRAVGSHGDILEYEGVQNWAEHISIFNNVIEGTPDTVSENENPRHRPGYINFVYHTRFLDVYNNTFARTVDCKADGKKLFTAVDIAKTCKGAEKKKEDKTIRIFSNVLRNMDAVTTDNGHYTVFDNLEVQQL